jgi:hypothetical protein
VRYSLIFHMSALWPAVEENRTRPRHLNRHQHCLHVATRLQHNYTPVQGQSVSALTSSYTPTMLMTMGDIGGKPNLRILHNTRATPCINDSKPTQSDIDPLQQVTQSCGFKL